MDAALEWFTQNATAIAALASLAALFQGFFGWSRGKLFKDERERFLSDLTKKNQEIENLAETLAKLGAQRAALDPETFRTQARELSFAGDKDAELYALAQAYVTDYGPHVARAAEYLAEIELWDESVPLDKRARETEPHLAIIRALTPKSLRLKDFETMQDAAARGEPVQAAQMDGMTGPELNRLSIALWSEGYIAQAEAAARRSVRQTLLAEGDRSLNYAIALSNHAKRLHSLGDPASAVVQYRKADALKLALQGRRDPKYMIGLKNMCGALIATGAAAEARKYLVQALEDIQEYDKGQAIQKGNTETIGELEAHLRLNLARAQAALGESAAAQTTFEEALALYDRSLGPDHDQTGVVWSWFANFLWGQGQRAEAIAKKRHALKIYEAALRENHPDILNTRAQLVAMEAAEATAPQGPAATTPPRPQQSPTGATYDPLNPLANLPEGPDDWDPNTPASPKDPA